MDDNLLVLTIKPTFDVGIVVEVVLVLVITFLFFPATTNIRKPI